MSKMKKLLTIFMWIFIFFSSSFASYTITLDNKQKIDNLAKKIYDRVEKKTKDKEKRNYIYQTIVDSIDGYIVLHDISKKNEAILLYLKTLLLKHMWYKIWDCKKLNFILW